MQASCFHTVSTLSDDRSTQIGGCVWGKWWFGYTLTVHSGEIKCAVTMYGVISTLDHISVVREKKLISLLPPLALYMCGGGEAILVKYFWIGSWYWQFRISVISLK